MSTRRRSRSRSGRRSSCSSAALSTSPALSAPSPMSSDLAIEARGLGKLYVLGERGRSPIRRNREELWALQDVGFGVERGTAMGIVGHNGAGKTTLLKILSRITAPSTGEARISGSVGSLLEVGTGF